MVKILNETNTNWGYESQKISYTIPESKHVYTPDFIFENGILGEGKGFISDHAERYKYILVKQQHPEIDLRFIFDNPNKLCGGTKYSHAQWATKYGFKYCSVKDVDTIKEWAKEQNGD